MTTCTVNQCIPRPRTSPPPLRFSLHKPPSRTSFCKGPSLAGSLFVQSTLRISQRSKQLVSNASQKHRSKSRQLWLHLTDGRSRNCIATIDLAGRLTGTMQALPAQLVCSFPVGVLGF